MRFDQLFHLFVASRVFTAGGLLFGDSNLISSSFSRNIFPEQIGLSPF